MSDCAETPLIREARFQLALDRWLEIAIASYCDHSDWLRSLGTGNVQSTNVVQAHISYLQAEAARVQPYLQAFEADNGCRSAEELQFIATHLSPGGAHNGGLLVRLVIDEFPYAEPMIVAATIWWNWHGGKIGFQFMPDPPNEDSWMDLDDYQRAAWDLMNIFDSATGKDPTRILTGEDRKFFLSLPDWITIYRGAANLDTQTIGSGVCWTTRRDVAEWFALRSAGADVSKATVLTCRIKKCEVRAAKAAECEVVCIPRKARQIKCRPHPLGWKPDEN